MTPAERMLRWRAADAVDDLVECLVTVNGLPADFIAARLEGAASALRDAPTVAKRRERERLKAEQIESERVELRPECPDVVEADIWGDAIAVGSRA
jgi:hypothetical protein